MSTVSRFKDWISLSKRQTEELAKYSFDLSKLTLGSWVLGLFTTKVELLQVIVATTGLILSILFFIIGLKLFREVK